MTIEVSAVVNSTVTQREYDQLSDNVLIKLIGDHRDQSALTELYGRYRVQICGFLQQRMFQPKLIEEIYNDVMLTVWDRANSFRSESKVSTWLFGITYNKRLAHTRKESRHLHSSLDDHVTSIGQAEGVAAEQRSTIQENLQAALAELSEQHRAVIELSYFHGYSTTEIAEIVGCPQNTVKTRLFHARKKLKSALETESSSAGVVNEYQSKRAENSHSLPQFAVC